MKIRGWLVVWVIMADNEFRDRSAMIFFVKPL